MNKTKVLHLITGLGVGGAEKVLLDLSTELKEYSDLELYVYSISDRNELYNSFVTRGISTKIFFARRSVSSLFSTFFHLLKDVKHNNVDIVHAHMAHSIFFASLLKIFYPRIKIVFTSHNYNIGSKLREYVVWLLRPLRNVDIIFSSDMNAFFYVKNIIIMPNGVYTNQYQIEPNYQKCFTFISIARLEKPKNQLFLIDKISEIVADGYSCQLLIVGDGSLRQELEEKIQNLNLTNVIHLLGLREDIPYLLSISNCFVLPSLWEGLPISILEAGAAGVPIISNSVGSIPSILNSENSYLCTLSNFKENMIEVIKNYNLALLKAKRFQEDVKNSFDISVIAKKHYNIYKSLVS